MPCSMMSPPASSHVESGGHGWIPSAALAESSRRWERFRSTMLARNCCSLARPSFGWHYLSNATCLYCVLPICYRV